MLKFISACLLLLLLLLLLPCGSQTGVTPDWQEGNQAGRRLQGTKHANKAQVERLEALLKTGVTPDWQEGIQAGRKM